MEVTMGEVLAAWGQVLRLGEVEELPAKQKWTALRLKKALKEHVEPYDKVRADTARGLADDGASELPAEMRPQFNEAMKPILAAEVEVRGEPYEISAKYIPKTNDIDILDEGKIVRVIDLPKEAGLPEIEEDKDERPLAEQADAEEETADE